MPVLTKDRSELTVIDKGAGGITDFTPGCKIQPEEMGGLLRRISLLPEVRWHRVIAVRQQIAEGKYDCDEKIDKIFDKLLASGFWI